MDTARVNIGSNETIRLSTLKALNLLDTEKEERFERIIRLIKRIFGVPVSGISLIDSDRIWYKSVEGILEKQVPRANSFEEQVLKSLDFYMTNDAQTDPNLIRHPLVFGGPRLKFYAGVPLRADNGEILGALFIADRIDRGISDLETQFLKDLASWVELEMNGKKGVGNNNLELSEVKKELNVKSRELEIENIKNQTVLESIGDGVILINDKGEITYANRQVEILTGWKEDEIKGKLLIHAIKLVDEKDNEVSVAENPIRNALFTNKNIASNKYFYVRKDMSKFAVSIAATPVVLYGQIIGGVNVFSDVSHEREIDRMKTEFISLASHQLRTPLSAMKWFTEMLIDGELGPLNAEQKEIAENIYQSNERMIELVNTLLNISRIESGRIIIDPKPTDIKKLIDEVVLELQPGIQKKKHNLVVSVHGELPLVNIDPKLIRHVYMNLLTNAIKYTQEQGEIVVMISRSGNELISQISDNGYGIPNSEQESVFTKFFRAKNIISVETDGTGLGLYLTKAIVDSSGGKIWFESKERKGTTFWFILPLQGMHIKEGEVSLDS